MKQRITRPWSPAALVRMFLIAAIVVVLIAETLSGALPRALSPWLEFAGSAGIEGSLRTDTPLPLPTPFTIPNEAGAAIGRFGDRSS
jgi:hypothetical protein